MNYKNGIYSGLLAFWMLLIFFFSNQPASISENNSDVVTSCLIETVSGLIDHPISDSKKLDLIKNTRFIIRKTAHFTLYFILNIICYFTLKSFSVKRCLLYSIIFSFLFACTDEFHQLFISNRSGRFFDVLIDTSGAIVSSIVILGIYKFKNRKKLY